MMSTAINCPLHPSMPVMSHDDPPRTWYAACRAFFCVPEAMRCVVSRQTLAHYRRVTRLPRDLGEDLDRRSAPLSVFKWIAWGQGSALGGQGSALGGQGSALGGQGSAP